MARMIALTLLLTGCAGPCRMTLAHGGDWHAPLDVYQLQPGVSCDF